MFFIVAWGNRRCCLLRGLLPYGAGSGARHQGRRWLLSCRGGLWRKAPRKALASFLSGRALAKGTKEGVSLRLYSYYSHYMI